MIDVERKHWDTFGIPMSSHPMLGADKLSSFRDHDSEREWFFLSNMYPCHITYKGHEYECAEAAIQAQKYPGHEKEFRNLLYAKAKKYNPGNGMSKAAWYFKSMGVLLEVVRAKFTQNPELGKKLVAFNGMNPIIEATNFDNFYGTKRGFGANCLGQALTIVRAELIAAKTDGATTSDTGIPKASKGTSVTEAGNKVSKEEIEMFNSEKQKELIATIIAKNAKVVIPGGTKTVEGATTLFSDSWNPYIDATDDGLHFQGFPGKEAEELAFVGATQGVTVAENGLVVGMAALTNSSLGMISYRGNVSLGSDTQMAETVIRVENNAISKVTTGGAEMSANFIKLKESSKEEVVKFAASDGYKLETRVLDRVDETTVLELLQEAADHLKNNPGATFGFFAAVPAPNNSDDKPQKLETKPKVEKRTSIIASATPEDVEKVATKEDSGKNDDLERRLEIVENRAKQIPIVTTTTVKDDKSVQQSSSTADENKTTIVNPVLVKKSHTPWEGKPIGADFFDFTEDSGEDGNETKDSEDGEDSSKENSNEYTLEEIKKLLWSDTQQLVRVPVVYPALNKKLNTTAQDKMVSNLNKWLRDASISLETFARMCKELSKKKGGFTTGNSLAVDEVGVYWKDVNGSKEYYLVVDGSLQPV